MIWKTERPRRTHSARPIILLLAGILLTGSLGTHTVEAATHYVKPAGTGDCSSWAAACTLQTALSAATSGDEIWVMEGTHTPTTDTARTVSFELKTGVALYGGFAGSETSRDQRDWETHMTILSGDLNGDDDGFVHNDENSYHVVVGSGTDSSAVLDGFTISGGNANGLSEDDSKKGGGMFNDLGHPTVTHCAFSGNTAAHDGGGMYNRQGSPSVTDCAFSGNTAAHDGGGMYNTWSNPTVTDCAFRDNTATGDGGGMYEDSSNPTVTDCAFRDNTALDGGGMLNDDNSSPTVTNCTFHGNTAARGGGGMLNDNNSNPTVTDCAFSGNTAGDGNGGGMVNYDSSNPTVTNCTFHGNTATGDGGGMANDDSSNPTVTNCTFSGNTAARYGGGMANDDNSNPTVTNCAFSGNTSEGGNGGGMFNCSSSPTVTNCAFSDNTAAYGGGMRDFADSSPTVTNCIFWGSPILAFTSSVTYCDVEGGYGDPDDHNMNADPLFVDAENGDLRVQACSPVIDAGNNAAVPTGVTTDLDGTPRIQQGTVDMGAYEAATAVNQAPEMTTPLADVSVDEDAPETLVNLASSFSDPETESSSLTYTVANTNPALATATISGSRLSLEYVPDANGSAEITITAADPCGLSVDETFSVTVTAVPDPEISLREISTQTEIPHQGQYNLGPVEANAFMLLEFAIRNSGVIDLQLAGSPLVALSGPQADEFDVLQPPAASIPPDGSTTCTLLFVCGSSAAHSATVTIANNDSDEGPYVFTLLANQPETSSFILWTR